MPCPAPPRAPQDKPHFTSGTAGVAEEGTVCEITRKATFKRGMTFRNVGVNYVHKGNWATVAHELGLRHNGLKTLLARARKDLRDCLERTRIDPGTQA